MVYSRKVILKGVWRYTIQSFEDFKSTHFVSCTADFLQLYTVPVTVYHFQCTFLNVLEKGLGKIVTSYIGQ